MNLKTILIVSALGAVTAANAATLAVFNFNDATTTPSAANTVQLFDVDRTGTGVFSAGLSSNFEATFITAFTGSVIGADSGDVAGIELALQGGTATGTAPNQTFASNGRFLDLNIAAVAGSALDLTTLTFATRRSGTGFNSQAFSYSVDGTNFVALSTNTTFSGGTGAATAVTSVDLSSIPLSSSVVIRNTLTGVSSSTGNNRFDNLVVSGSVQAVPEPASMVALGVGAVAMLRRRKKA